MIRPARLSELVPGTRVIYWGSWGRGAMHDGEITSGPELNGEEFVWNVMLDNGRKHWGYRDQYSIEESAEKAA